MRDGLVGMGRGEYPSRISEWVDVGVLDVRLVIRLTSMIWYDMMIPLEKQMNVLWEDVYMYLFGRRVARLALGCMRFCGADVCVFYRDIWSWGLNILVWFVASLRSHDATQDISNFLPSIISDLCSNAPIIPEKVKDLLSKCNHGRQFPTTDKLLEILAAFHPIFTDVYLVVNALDEFLLAKRHNLLKILDRIFGLKSDALHLFVTSEGEINIQKFFETLPETSHAFWSIEAKGEHMEMDIQKCIDRQFNLNEKLENGKLTSGNKWKIK